MKKTIITLSILFALTFTSQAQGDFKFGITGGLLNSDFDITSSVLGINLADFDAINKTGFYVGALADIGITEAFHVQPELTYGSAGDLSFIYLPIMAKYYVMPNKLYILGGPQFAFSSNIDEIKNTISAVDSSGEVDDFFNSTGIDIGFGAGFDITDQFSVQARYAFELSNRFSDNPGGFTGTLLNLTNLEGKANTLTVGIVYFFN